MLDNITIKKYNFNKESTISVMITKIICSKLVSKIICVNYFQRRETLLASLIIKSNSYS